MDNERKVTIKDIAEMAGTSKNDGFFLFKWKDRKDV